MRILHLGLSVGVVAAIVVTALTHTPAVAQQSRAKVGVLSCAMSASIGLVIGSKQRLRCRFTPDAGAPESYFGSITRLGLDLGVTAGGVMSWLVFAPTSQPARGALAGSFVGASADAAIGVGLGANVLVGGSNRTIALQPLSVEVQAGINLALGVAGLHLQYAP